MREKIANLMELRKGWWALFFTRRWIMRTDAKDMVKAASHELLGQIKWGMLGWIRTATTVDQR